MMNVFPKADVLMTNTIHHEAEIDDGFYVEIMQATERFRKKDWGIVSDDDKVSNDIALRNRIRVCGSYKTSKGEIQIVAKSEDHKEYTLMVIMFPDEYW